MKSSFCETIAGRPPLSASCSSSLMDFSLVFDEFGTVGSSEPTRMPGKLKCLFVDASKVKLIGEIDVTRIRVAIACLTPCRMSVRSHLFMNPDPFMGLTQKRPPALVPASMRVDALISTLPGGSSMWHKEEDFPLVKLASTLFVRTCSFSPHQTYRSP